MSSPGRHEERIALHVGGKKVPHRREIKDQEVGRRRLPIDTSSFGEVRIEGTEERRREPDGPLGHAGLPLRSRWRSSAAFASIRTRTAVGRSSRLVIVPASTAAARSSGVMRSMSAAVMIRRWGMRFSLPGPRTRANAQASDPCARSLRKVSGGFESRLSLSASDPVLTQWMCRVRTVATRRFGSASVQSLRYAPGGPNVGVGERGLRPTNICSRFARGYATRS